MFVGKVVVVEDMLRVYPFVGSVIGGVPCTLVLLMCGPHYSPYTSSNKVAYFATSNQIGSNMLLSLNFLCFNKSMSLYVMIEPFYLQEPYRLSLKKIKIMEPRRVFIPHPFWYGGFLMFQE